MDTTINSNNHDGNIHHRKKGHSSSPMKTTTTSITLAVSSTNTMTLPSYNEPFHSKGFGKVLFPAKVARQLTIKGGQGLGSTACMCLLFMTIMIWLLPQIPEMDDKHRPWHASYWHVFQDDYFRRYQRNPPDSLKHWLAYARYWN